MQLLSSRRATRAFVVVLLATAFAAPAAQSPVPAGSPTFAPTVDLAR